MAKTNVGLVEYAKAQLGKEYWYGTYGSAASKKYYDAKKKQYPKHYEWSYKSKWEGQKVHDCVGLIKGYLWCDSPDDTTPKYNKDQDVSANGMRSRCKISGQMATMPDVLGVLVFMDGHVGVYIGGGEVVEARGHAFGVVRTKLSERKWTSWGYCPFIEYTTESKTEEDVKVSIKLDVLRRGVKGSQVEAVQILLEGLGYKLPKYGSDGEFGAETEAAVKKYQTHKKLAADGVVGAATWSALLGV